MKASKTLTKKSVANEPTEVGFISLRRLPHPMRLRRLPVLLVFALMMCSGSASALPAVEVDNGMIFGGQSASANNATTATNNLSDLAAVVEVYTATWCDNCVHVEHALEEVHDGGHLTAYHIHSTLSDPFGDEALEQRFRDRYVHLTDYSHSPPGVVFNGTVKKAGSVPDVDVHDNDHDNLVEEFTGFAQRDLALGAGTTVFSWTPMSETSGTVGWALDIDERLLENMTLNVAAWVVESTADYEEGTNGQGTYPHIVRAMVSLGNQTEGTATLALPTPHDGDDLEIHLVYEIVPVVPETPEDNGSGEESEENNTPSLSFASTAMTVGLALAFTRTGRRSH